MIIMDKKLYHEIVEMQNRFYYCGLSMDQSIIKVVEYLSNKKGIFVTKEYVKELLGIEQ
jgi:hypothetical protein